MEDQDLIYSAIGLCLPPILAVIIRHRWGDTVRTVICFVAYALVAMLAAWFLQKIGWIQDFTLRGVLAAFAWISLVGYLSFKVMYKNTPLLGKLASG